MNPDCWSVACSERRERAPYRRERCCGYDRQPQICCPERWQSGLALLHLGGNCSSRCPRAWRSVIARGRGGSTQCLRALTAYGKHKQRGGDQQGYVGPDCQIVGAANVEKVAA